MSKQIIYSENSRDKVRSATKKVVDAVKVTLGPAGRNVLLQDTSSGSVVVSKDGVTVINGISLEDSYENLVAGLIKDTCKEHNDECGDGSTSIAVLAGAIVDEGIKAVTAGSNPIFIKRGMDKATSLIVDGIKKVSKAVNGTDDIKAVAAISANNDPVMGDLVAEAIEKVGKDGVITVEESKNMNTTVKVTEGMQLDGGYISPYFATDGSKQIEYSDAFILLYDKTISSMRDVLPILEKVAQSGKPLVIIAENVDSEALTTMVINNMRGALKVCAVKAPGFGDYRKALLEDVAALTGGTLITEDIGLKLDKVDLSQLGRAKSIKISKDETVIVNGYGDKEKIDARIAEIKNAIDNDNGSTSRDTLDMSRLHDRLAKLSGGVAVIEMGAATETEMKEKRYRIDDTLAATKAALEEGIVAGGGTTLIHVADEVLSDDVIKSITDEDEKIGFKIIKKAVEKPLWQIAENAGVSGDVVVDTVKHPTNAFDGYNAKTGKYVKMLDSGILDPAKVTRSAIQNATSIAGMLLTAECIIADKPEKKSETAMMPNGQPMIM